MNIKNLHISDFGEKIYFDRVSDLIDALVSQFKSCSVAVKWVDGITDMKQMYLVSVDENGVIKSSHKEEVVDLNVIIK